jgi:hypothetical protein
MEGLTFVKGYSFETLTQKLAAAEIPFEVRLEPGQHPPNSYFRFSELVIREKFMAEVDEKLGLADFKQNKLRGNDLRKYFGEYALAPNFDISQLNGNLRFNEGRLVEAIRILYQKSRVSVSNVR